MLNIITATYKKNRITKKRAYPWTFILGRLINGISAIAFPFFIYTFLFRENIDQSFYKYTESSNYITYIVSGVAVNILGIATLMNIGRALVKELREGTLEMVILSPASRIGYFIGCQLENLVHSMIQFGVILVFGAILGANFETLFSIEATLVILIIIYSFFTMGVFLSSIMLYTRDTYISQNTLFVLMNLLCGVSFPIEYLPKFIQPLSHVFPMTAALKLFRSVVISQQSIATNMNFVYEVIGLSTLYIIIGLFWNKRIEKKLMESIFG